MKKQLLPNSPDNMSRRAFINREPLEGFEEYLKAMVEMTEEHSKLMRAFADAFTEHMDATGEDLRQDITE